MAHQRQCPWASQGSLSQVHIPGWARSPFAPTLGCSELSSRRLAAGRGRKDPLYPASETLTSRPRSGLSQSQGQSCAPAVLWENGLWRPLACRGTKDQLPSVAWCPQEYVAVVLETSVQRNGKGTPSFRPGAPSPVCGSQAVFPQSTVPRAFLPLPAWLLPTVGPSPPAQFSLFPSI